MKLGDIFSWWLFGEPDLFTQQKGPTTMQVDIKAFDQMVFSLAKSGGQILTALTAQKVDLWHHASCILGEAGELFDATKKWIIYDGALNRENVIEELGDLEFYMEGVRQNLGITRDETLEYNMRKLAKRYPNFNYSDSHAIYRADKEV